MELKKLRIQNFKSIKTVQNIDLSQPLITLIGKNGSGKTNVLDGIFTVFDSRSTKEREGMDYRFFIEINDKELNEYNDILNIDNNSPIIEAYALKRRIIWI